jgi:acetyl esterase/lipase
MFSLTNYAQELKLNDSAFEKYLSEQETLNQSFAKYFYGNFAQIYSSNESKFISIIDSLRQSYTILLSRFEKENPNFDKSVLFKESKDIDYAFDKFLVEYPYYHERFSDEKKTINKRLDDNLKDFNNPELLNIGSYVEYLKAFLYYHSKIELENDTYKKLDNQQLNATLNLIPKYFSNKIVIDYLKFYYLNNHIENLGIKNIDSLYKDFVINCKDTSYVNKIKSFYTEEENGRKGHLIKTYKTVDNYYLEIHLFLPENDNQQKKRPVIVYFNGGSWSEGKPDWSFSACQTFANKGWVGVTVEYRLAYRQGTLPFESVMDAKSAIRWLRQHADEYNIDTNKIVASGNSAGGHLVLATALVENWNEKTDSLKYSPVPNVLMVNSGVYDLTDDNSWIRQGLRNRNQDENLVKEISPNYLIKKGLPPILIIHGTNDKNVPFSTAKEFVDRMKLEGNEIEFHVLEGAGHFIWWGQYGKQVSEIRSKFLEKLEY